MSDQSNDSQEEFNRKQKYWDALDRSGAEESRAYDKSVLTLSSAALGVSLILLKDIAGVSPKATWALVLSWAALVLSITFTLLSMRISPGAHDKEMQSLNKDESESGPEADNRSSCFITVANWLSFVFFVVGVVFLCVFAFLNM